MRSDKTSPFTIDITAEVLSDLQQRLKKTRWSYQIENIGAEELVNGRQTEYLRHFFSFGKFSPTETAQYVNSYATPAQIHAAFEMYRAFPANVKFNLAPARGK